MKCRFLSAVICFILLTLVSRAQKQEFDLESSVVRGREIYTAQCMSCHMQEGEGIEDVYPPLAKSDYLMDDKERSIKSILQGVTGEITVNGKKYDMDMIGFTMTDEEVSDVLNYVRNAWGNSGEPVTPEEVGKVR